MDRQPSDPPADFDEPDKDGETPGSRPQEKVEDRPNVGTVEPEDYPEADRER
jgi:hypothetical protein